MAPSPLSSIRSLASVTSALLNATCRNIPGDPGWPSPQAWNHLNETVQGRLIAPRPLADVCHAPDYNEVECAALQQAFGLPNTMVPEASEFMAPWFQNNTCSPYSDPDTPCELGNYVNYAVDVSCVEDVQAGLSFARHHNIRMVIKASGHDWFGKSTGLGALSLWTHNLIDKQIIPEYTSTVYTGPAAKLGAGVMGGDASEFVAEAGYRLVAGTCPTVTPAGGFTQGGGHSLLTGLYGFGADNVLEWEVVTANGTHLVASPTENTDLYWALSGGGGGTFGAVMSMTVRIFPDAPVAISTLSFNSTIAGGQDQHWQAVAAFHRELQRLTDGDGMVADYLMTNTSLNVVGILAPGFDQDRLSMAMAPMIDVLSNATLGSLNAQNMALDVSASDSYYNLYAQVVRPLTEAAMLAPVLGGRLVSRENMASNASAVIDAFRSITADGRFFMATRALHSDSTARVVRPIADNSMQPAFKEAFLSVIISAAWNATTYPWEEAAVLQDELLSDVMPELEVATPGSGVYNNEGNWQQPNWQEAFYGDTYDRLSRIKNTYDPNGTFYGLTSVASELWAPDSSGRLCRTME